MSITESQVERFAALYAGLNRAYGRYDTNQHPNPETGKLEGKALTVKKPVTLELYENHLNGKSSIGIIPIDDDGMTQYAVLDIDDYNLKPSFVRDVIQHHGIPMLILMSKSDGVHLTAYFKERVPAKWARQILDAVHKLLGKPKSDLFPRQARLANPEDVGNWINLPYFGDTRRMWGDKTLEQFLTAAEASRRTKAEWDALNLIEKARDPMDDAPPCLQQLMSEGIPQGGRNKTLFNFAVLYKKMHGEDFPQHVIATNKNSVNPPLPQGEVTGIINSVSRGDYFYTCAEEPICSICDKTECRKRKHGIGGDKTLNAAITGLTKVETDPVTWYLTVDDCRIELDTAGLYNWRAVQLAAADALTKHLPSMKNGDWMALLAELMDNCETIHMPPDSGTGGAFVAHIHEWLQGGSASAQKDDLLNGVPWFDSDTQTYAFRINDLMDYLKNRRFNAYSQGKVAAKLKDLGAESCSGKIKGAFVRWWKFTPMTEGQTEDFDIPEIRELDNEETDTGAAGDGENYDFT